jgi:hypothetical protein
MNQFIRIPWVLIRAMLRVAFRVMRVTQCRHTFHPARGPMVRCIRVFGHWGQHGGFIQSGAMFRWCNRNVTRDADG